MLELALPMNVVGNYALVRDVCAALQVGLRVYSGLYLLRPWKGERGCYVQERRRGPDGVWLKTFDDFYDGATWFLRTVREGREIGVTR